MPIVGFVFPVLPVGAKQYSVTLVHHWISISDSVTAESSRDQHRLGYLWVVRRILKICCIVLRASGTQTLGLGSVLHHTDASYKVVTSHSVVLLKQMTGWMVCKSRQLAWLNSCRMSCEIRSRTPSVRS
jgi:hypothetical protein